MFFPLLTQPDMYTDDQNNRAGDILHGPITNAHLTAETIKLIASTLDDDLANQHQMLLLSGFQVLGFLLQSIAPQKINLEILSALKHLFGVVANGGKARTMFCLFFHLLSVHSSLSFFWCW